MVHKTILPKVPGYVETVVDDRHVYRNIETGEITDHPTPPETGPTAEEDLMSMTVDHEYRITMLELGITE